MQVFAGLGPRQVGAAGAWLGFAGLGPRQVAVRAGHVGRLAGFGRWGWQAGRLGSAGGAGRARRQAGSVRAGQWGKQGQPGLGLALLGWVLGRWQSGVGRQAGQGSGLGFAGLGPRQAAAGAAGARLGFPGLGLRQVGQQGSELGFAGLGPRQLGFAGLGSRQVAVRAWLGFARLGPRQVAGGVGRQAGAAGAAGAWLGWGRVGRDGRAGGLGLALLGWVLGRWQSGQGRWGMQGQPGLVLAWLWLGSALLGGWGRSVGKGRADQLVPDEDIEGDEGTALGSRRAFALRGSRINVGVTEGRLRFCYIGATVTCIEILILAIDRGGIRLGVIGLAVAAAQVKQTLDPSTKTLANVDGIKWFDDEPDGPGSADSTKDGLKRAMGDRGGRYIREPSAEEELLPAGFGRWAGKISQEVSQMVLGAIPGWRVAGDDDETPPAFRPEKEEGSKQRKQAGLGSVGTGQAGGGVEAGRERIDIAGLTTQGILQGRQRDVDIAGLTTQGILQGRQRKGPGGDNMLWRNEDCLTDKEAVGREEAGRQPEGDRKGSLERGGYDRIAYQRISEVSVGLVRRQETLRRLKDQRRTDIRDISKAVIGRVVNLLIKLGVGRRARQRHTEVQSSYHFRAGTKVNSTSGWASGGRGTTAKGGGLEDWVWNTQGKGED
ncbi:hypothetical protein BY996DRAFT_6509695 [Phakopsora pachyrhizi]|nr:hypothetical protein BY996DRAFT_6509695 [Phakopsora pachyrhizi]